MDTSRSRFRGAAILLGIALLGGLGLPFYARADHSPVDLRSSSLTAAMVKKGRTVTFVAEMSATSRNWVIVDLELYNSQDERVSQTYSFATFEGSREFKMKSPSDLPPGTYYFSVGIFRPNLWSLFNPGWAEPLHWHHAVKTFRVYESSPCEGDCELHVISAKERNGRIEVMVESPNFSNTVLVDLELHDSSGRRVAQAFWDEQHFGSSERKAYVLNLPELAPGEYDLSVGVFYPAWLDLVKWNPQVLTLRR